MDKQAFNKFTRKFTSPCIRMNSCKKLKTQIPLFMTFLDVIEHDKTIKKNLSVSFSVHMFVCLSVFMSVSMSIYMTVIPKAHIKLILVPKFL
jgi:hypothetical protein